MRTHGLASCHLGTRCCRALADRMEPCWHPIEGITVISCLVLGESWFKAVDALARILIRAEPSSEEAANRLILAYAGYCDRIERRSTPAAFRERAHNCRQVTEFVASRMSMLLGRSFVAFESSIPLLAFPIRAASPLWSRPFSVGIAEVECP